MGASWPTSAACSTRKGSRHSTQRAAPFCEETVSTKPTAKKPTTYASTHTPHSTEVYHPRQAKKGRSRPLGQVFGEMAPESNSVVRGRQYLSALETSTSRPDRGRRERTGHCQFWQTGRFITDDRYRSTQESPSDANSSSTTSVSNGRSSKASSASSDSSDHRLGPFNSSSPTVSSPNR